MATGGGGPPRDEPPRGGGNNNPNNEGDDNSNDEEDEDLIPPPSPPLCQSPTNPVGGFPTPPRPGPPAHTMEPSNDQAYVFYPPNQWILLNIQHGGRGEQTPPGVDRVLAEA